LVPDDDKEMMMLNRPQQLLIASAVAAAIALGSSAIAGAATDSSGSSSATAAVHGSAGAARPLAVTYADVRGKGSRASAESTVTADAEVEAGPAVLASGSGGATGAINHDWASWIGDLDLTDHEQYLRHHRRLAAIA
jgi:hypothetical protein